MPDESRNIDDIVDDLKRLNSEFRQKIQEGTRDADSFMKLHEMIWVSKAPNKNDPSYTQPK